MSLRDDFEDDILVAFEDLAESALYLPKAGGQIVTLAMVEGRRLDSGRLARGEYATLRLPVRDVPAPEVDDLIQVDGETWQHRPATDETDIRSRSGPFWLLACRRELRATPGGGAA